MIKKAMQTRKQKLEKNQDLLVDMRPEFVNALRNCISFSSKLDFKVTVL